METPELTSDSNDATQLTLISLQELSAVAVALAVWRSEINKYRRNADLENFNPEKLRISLKTPFPDLPSVIDAMIGENVSRFGFSIENWLEQHYKKVLFFNYGHRNYVLHDFDDFSCDYNGAIDYVKTAERMMQCEKLGEVEKFKIACVYFFEQDIRRLWPSVWMKVGLDNIELYDFPQLYYWISRLRNDLNKIPSDEMMFSSYMPHNRPSLEYFWNRMSSELQKVRGERVLKKDTLSFTRFILPKLNVPQLREFVAKNGAVLMEDLLRHRHFDEKLVLQTWLYMRNVMNKKNFRNLVLEMMQFESRKFRPEYLYYRDLKNYVYLCNEIWNSASRILRQSAIRKISSKSSFSYIREGKVENSSEFLLTVLSCATFEERSSFWHNNWFNLIKIKTARDLQTIMKLCFENDDEIIQYKENVVAKSKHAQDVCANYLTTPDFDELNDFVDFCCPNRETSRCFKQQLLQSNFLGEESVFQLEYLKKATQFNEFICNAYNDADLATNFKNQLMLSHVTEHVLRLVTFSKHIKFNHLVKFVETLISTEEIMQQIKVLVINNMKTCVIANKHCMGILRFESSFDPFLFWCFGSHVEAKRFKESYIPRTI